MEPDNSEAEIDKRINMAMAFMPKGPHRIFIGDVYRPYCKAMMRMHNKEDVDEVISAACSLIANIISDVSRASSDNPDGLKMHIVDQVRQMLIDGPHSKMDS